VKKYFSLGILALPAMILMGCASATSAPQPLTVTLRSPYGAVLGNVTLAADPAGGVKFSVQVRGLTPGKHGFHIHTIGKCEGFDFASAGAHFNPDNKKHGSASPDGPHAGDLANLEVGADGSAAVEFTHKTVSLSPSSLLKPDGTALVIHAAEDDLKTDPTGNSGGRVACGLIVANPPAPGASN
jgi:Cu-Zn family superoxide dismutase